MRPSVAVLFDRLELGFGGVAFTHHPIERFEEIVDARARGFRYPVTNDLVDLPSGLSLQQQLCIFLVQANHSVPSLSYSPACYSATSIPMLRAVPITMRSAASTDA